MSVFGLNVYKADGAILVNDQMEIARARYYVAVSQSSSGGVTLPDISGKKTIEVALPINVAITNAGHIISRVNTTITWEVWTGSFLAPASSLIYSFLYS